MNPIEMTIIVILSYINNIELKVNKFNVFL